MNRTGDRFLANCTGPVRLQPSTYSLVCEGGPAQHAQQTTYSRHPGAGGRRKCRLAQRDFKQLGAVVRLIDYWTGAALAEQQLTASQQLLEALTPEITATRLPTVRPACCGTVCAVHTTGAADRFR